MGHPLTALITPDRIPASTADFYLLPLLQEGPYTMVPIILELLDYWQQQLGFADAPPRLTPKSVPTANSSVTWPTNLATCLKPATTPNDCSQVRPRHGPLVMPHRVILSSSLKYGSASRFDRWYKPFGKT